LFGGKILRRKKGGKKQKNLRGGENDGSRTCGKKKQIPRKKKGTAVENEEKERRKCKMQLTGFSLETSKTWGKFGNRPTPDVRPKKNAPCGKKKKAQEGEKGKKITKKKQLPSLLWGANQKKKAPEGRFLIEKKGLKREVPLINQEEGVSKRQKRRN